MRVFLEVARTGLAAVLLHPLRSAVTCAAVLAVLLPYLVGVGLSEGIEAQAAEAVRSGADLYVSGEQFGRTVPLPLAAVDEVRKIDGVTAVVPRIVGRIVLGKDLENVVLVGVPPGQFPATPQSVDGKLTEGTALNELVVGSELARRLKLKVGSYIPPFYRNARGERVSKVVGVFKPDAPLWQARLVLTSFDTAAAIFNQEGTATDLLVSCRPGYQDQVRAQLVRSLSFPGPTQGAGVRARVVTREELQALLPRGVLRRGGLFNLHFVVAFAVGILAVLVTSGFGLPGRRREIGILKATGWQTDEVLLRALVESFVLSLAAAALAVILAFVWLRGFNGYGIAGVFLAGVDREPAFQVPFRLAPVPSLLAFVVSCVVVMSGNVYSSWRAATVAPVEAMR